jgi:hypothetical protein
MEENWIRRDNIETTSNATYAIYVNVKRHLRHKRQTSNAIYVNAPCGRAQRVGMSWSSRKPPVTGHTRLGARQCCIPPCGKADRKGQYEQKRFFLSVVPGVNLTFPRRHTRKIYRANGFNTCYH